MNWSQRPSTVTARLLPGIRFCRRASSRRRDQFTIVVILSKVRRCARLPRNTCGRDLVVGDLHGHLDLLEKELLRISFDPACDRLLSVGDLIDRGPDSLGTLALLEEPWFHCVLGNHELMLLNYLGYYSSRKHSRKSYAHGSSAWIHEALGRHPKLVSRLADRVAALPLMLKVSDEVPFNVMHGDLLSPGVDAASLLEPGELCTHKADRLTSSRTNITQALTRDLTLLQFSGQQVRVSDAPLGDLPWTYVGHSPLRDVTVHNSYIYIDQGVCLRPSKHAPPILPTLLDHRQFARWIGGVAMACHRDSLAA